jgi:hypothetical protein
MVKKWNVAFLMKVYFHMTWVYLAWTLLCQFTAADDGYKIGLTITAGWYSLMLFTWKLGKHNEENKWKNKLYFSASYAMATMGFVWVFLMKYHIGTMNSSTNLELTLEIGGLVWLILFLIKNFTGNFMFGYLSVYWFGVLSYTLASSKMGFFDHFTFAISYHLSQDMLQKGWFFLILVGYMLRRRIFIDSKQTSLSIKKPKFIENIFSGDGIETKSEEATKAASKEEIKFNQKSTPSKPGLLRYGLKRYVHRKR